ncbi:MAG: penicillin-binding transpeptidase domain-containing protein, partial [Aggregatilineales bacterium]
MRVTFFAFITLLIMSGCTPSQQSQVIALPTLAPSPTASIDITAAQRTASLFMDAWQRQDYIAMYSLVSFAGQEATPYDTFEAIYSDSHNQMTLASLVVKQNSMRRDSDRVVLLNYDVTFFTERLGDFSDTNRNMILVWDDRAFNWRVAWSPGDIFPEMGTGATLRFESGAPQRANIYDRNGEVLADQNHTIVQVNVIKEDIPDLATCLSTLAPLVNRSVEILQDRLNRSGQTWVVEMGVMEPQVYNTNRTTLETACDASFNQQSSRRYPRGNLMPHILGHVGFPEESEIDALVRAGFDQETIIGKSGIEKSWDEVLRGQPGGVLSLVGADGVRLRELARNQTRIPASLWLTIDWKLQEYVQRVLGEAYLNAGDSWAQFSKGGSAIVFDVNTGEILAMVSYPTFDGNALTPYPAIGREVADIEQQRIAESIQLPMLNRVTQGAYPAGSIMKVVDSVAVLDSDLYTENTAFICSGIWQEGRDVRYDWLAGGHGRVTVETALAQSCNPFYYQTGFALNEFDPYLLPTYARQMGLGNVTGLTDLSEAPDTIPDPDWIRINRGVPWTFSHAVSMAIGQGEVEVTPLQMVRMYAAI